MSEMGQIRVAKTERIHSVTDDLKSRIEALEGLAGETRDSRMSAKAEEINGEITASRAKLNAEDEAYQDSVQARSKWLENVVDMLGQREDPESLLGRRRAVFRLRELPAVLDTLKSERRSLLLDLHKVLVAEATIYTDLHQPLQSYLKAQGVPDDYTLEVSTDLVDTGFANILLDDFVNRNVTGTFYGVQESRALVTQFFAKTDLADPTSVLALVETIDDGLHFDRRISPPVELSVWDQLKGDRTLAELYDFVYGLEYLSPRYVLKFGAKPIHRLSPGEKGVLLLIFLLLAEKETIPLVIDQPEDNLDNQTVVRALVTCFHKAKSRRQVVIVTHNANLAVVCDADQVIVARMKKDSGNRVTYIAGAIEDRIISQAIVDILEGTKPAFDNRSGKYSIHLD